MALDEAAVCSRCCSVMPAGARRCPECGMAPGRRRRWGLPLLVAAGIAASFLAYQWWISGRDAGRGKPMPAASLEVSRVEQEAEPVPEPPEDGEKEGTSVPEAPARWELDLGPESVAAHVVQAEDSGSAVITGARWICFARIREGASGSARKDGGEDTPRPLGMLVTSETIQVPPMPAGSYLLAATRQDLEAVARPDGPATMTLSLLQDAQIVALLEAEVTVAKDDRSSSLVYETGEGEYDRLTVGFVPGEPSLPSRRLTFTLQLLQGTLPPAR